MTHNIPIPPMNGPLPIPHLLQWPDYQGPNQYFAIIPKEMTVADGDLLQIGQGLKISILERRPAKGDWSKQNVHKNPDFIRFTAK